MTKDENELIKLIEAADNDAQSWGRLWDEAEREHRANPSAATSSMLREIQAEEAISYARFQKLLDGRCPVCYQFVCDNGDGWSC